MENLDFRLLQVFDEIYKTRSVSRAAERLGLGQPAVSIALGKLRQRLGNMIQKPNFCCQHAAPQLHDPVDIRGSDARPRHLDGGLDQREGERLDPVPVVLQIANLGLEQLRLDPVHIAEIGV